MFFISIIFSYPCHLKQSTCKYQIKQSIIITQEKRMEKWFRKIAVITGASTCIGQQLIKDLATAGLTVIGISRKKHIIEALAHKHKSSGKIHALECDISNPDAIKNTFKSIENDFGAMHIMINNAGRVRKGETMNGKTVPDEELISMINFSLTGVIWCTREAYKLMQKGNENGYIINVNGLVGTLVGEDKVRYANIYFATKYAVKNHTETVRLDLANANNKMIRVTVRISLVIGWMLKVT